MSQLLARTHGTELGWSLCTVIPAYRHMAKNYDEVIIVCDPAHEYLCRDFATDFEHYKAEGRTGLYGWYFRDKPIKMPKKLKKKYPDAKIVVPNEKICTKAPRKYFKYGKYDSRLEYDLVIHARSEVKFERDNRNWPIGRYMKVLNALRQEKYVSACSIGTKKGAYHSVSSGPLHLASLCGCPHIGWSDNKYQKAIKGNNKDRYYKIWNPFNTPVKFISKYGWRPGINAVYDKIKGFL